MKGFDPLQDILELQAIVWGRVQGVGFRGATRHYATQLDLKGIVRNLEDGNVEIIAQGARQDLEKLINQIKEHFASGYIARIDVKFTSPTTKYEQFTIVGF